MTVSKGPSAIAASGERARWKSPSTASSGAPRTTAVALTPASSRRRSSTRPTKPAAPTTASDPLDSAGIGQPLQEPHLPYEPVRAEDLVAVREQDAAQLQIEALDEVLVRPLGGDD